MGQKLHMTRIFCTFVALAALLPGCDGQGETATAPAPLAPPPPVQHAAVTPDRVFRVSTAVPFPRGMAMIEGQLYALARGRVRESGGADGKIDDQAGTIYALDPSIAEP